MNKINTKANISDKLWVAEVGNATSRNTVRAYAETIQEALTIIDRFADKDLSGSTVINIGLEEN